MDGLDWIGAPTYGSLADESVQVMHGLSLIGVLSMAHTICFKGSSTSACMDRIGIGLPIHGSHSMLQKNQYKCMNGLNWIGVPIHGSHSMLRKNQYKCMNGLNWIARSYQWLT
jgi:hypothetical protein